MSIALPDDGEETAQPEPTSEPENKPDTESLEAYVASLSPEECHALYDMLKAKYDGQEENKKYSLSDLAK